jgi:hypothetical protein
VHDRFDIIFTTLNFLQMAEYQHEQVASSCIPETSRFEPSLDKLVEGSNPARKQTNAMSLIHVLTRSRTEPVIQASPSSTLVIHGRDPDEVLAEDDRFAVAAFKFQPILCRGAARRSGCSPTLRRCEMVGGMSYSYLYLVD